MGYTHYFRQQEAVEQKTWDAYAKDVQTLLEHVTTDKGVVLQPDMETDHPHFVVDGTRICFNGDESQGLDHETFYLNRTTPGFSFCKTARKPYDLAACGCLILAYRHMPRAFDISSDGDAQDWQEALDCVQDLFKDIYELPPRVRAV